MTHEIALHSENPACAAERSVVLLADPDLDLLSYRALVMSRSHYTVVTASNYRGVFNLRDEGKVLLAVLSSSLGQMALRAAAEFVRRQWPSARILILGSANPRLDDSLYDEEVDCRFQPREFLNVLERLRKDDWTLRSQFFGSPPETDTHHEKGSTSRLLVAEESDPRKVTHYKQREEE
jgi:hypothetical protein